MTSRQRNVGPRSYVVAVLLRSLRYSGWRSGLTRTANRNPLTTTPHFGDRVLASVNDVVITGHSFRRAFDMLPP